MAIDHPPNGVDLGLHRLGHEHVRRFLLKPYRILPQAQLVAPTHGLVSPDQHQTFPKCFTRTDDHERIEFRSKTTTPWIPKRP